MTDTADEPFEVDAFEAAYVPPDGPGANDEPADEPSDSARTSSTPSPKAGQSRGDKRPIAPAARALAKKLGLDPTTIEGTGPNGRVTKADVEALAARRESLLEVEPGVGLEVLREGSGDGVALLPGLGTDVSAFALQTPKLAGSFAVAGINPRGVGQSDAPEMDLYSVERAADDVAAVLDGPTHIVGASLGSAVALELALRHPDRVRSLALITPFIEASPRLNAFARAWQRARTEAPAEACAEILLPWLFGDALLADEGARERVLRGLAQTVKRVPAEAIGRYAAGIADWSGRRKSDLGRIAVPTVVLLAGDDLLTTEGSSLAEAIPGARCETVPGRGHALAIDAADRVTEVLLDHLTATPLDRMTK